MHTVGNTEAGNTAPTDPILALINKYREGMAIFNASPEDGDDGVTAAATWAPYYQEMAEAPASQTLAGAIAALEFALDEYRGGTFSDEAEGMVRSALGFLQKSAPPPARPATRAELEAYRGWLHMEGRILGYELFPELGEDAGRYIPATAAHDLHLSRHVFWKDMPQPSARAVSVLTAVGANFEKINRQYEEDQREISTAACVEAARDLLAAEKSGAL